MITVVGNLKGGTGKSTVAFNLAVWLAHDKAGVKAFDLDPQCTLVDVGEVRVEDGYEPSFEVSTDLGELEALAKDKKNKQPIIVDMSATNMFAMEKAISLADRVLIPIQPSQADIWSTQRFLKIVNNNIDKKKTEVLGFLNRADTHIGVRETDEADQALQMMQGIKALGIRLHQRTAYRRSFSEGLAVFELDPMGKASKEMKQLAILLD
ncbi:MAG: AAA family ATPase [Gammaproteobacteria bacterium]|nr:AAA family ATPase [Gammaproteobacteria bacterium]NNJ48912.1 AAA family ATPase [Gammaproteobacteria bacterium]